MGSLNLYVILSFQICRLWYTILHVQNFSLCMVIKIRGWIIQSISDSDYLFGMYTQLIFCATIDWYIPALIWTQNKFCLWTLINHVKLKYGTEEIRSEVASNNSCDMWIKAIQYTFWVMLLLFYWFSLFYFVLCVWYFFFLCRVPHCHFTCVLSPINSRHPTWHP